MIKNNNISFSSVYDEITTIGKIMKGTLLVYESWKDIIANGVLPLTLYNCKGVDLLDYKIYGNSIQDGTPTPETPIEVESTGDKTKNLFDYSTLLNNNNIELIDETKGEFKFIYPYGIPSTYIKAKENTSYTISYKVKLVKEQVVTLTIYYTDGTYSSVSIINGIVGEYVTVKGTSTANKTIDYIKFGGSGGLQTDTCFKEIQVEEGTVATEYEPYGYKIPVKVSNDKEETTTNIYLKEPLRKIENYADYIDFENKKVVRKIAKEELLSTWKWNDYGTSGAHTNSFEHAGISTYKVTSNYGKSASKVYSFSNAYLNKIAISYSWLGVADVTGLKEKLAEYEANGRPFIVYYPTNEEIEETIELPNIPTYKGTNILDVKTNIKPSNMEVIYEGKKPQLLNTEDNEILNYMLATDTNTELDITEDKINQILDEIIGG